jgi:hypothetical protein
MKSSRRYLIGFDGEIRYKRPYPRDLPAILAVYFLWSIGFKACSNTPSSDTYMGL